MRRIVNPWSGHPRYNCFGCAPGNPFGLHMEFFEDGDDIVSTWRPRQNYQGWVDTMHGGVLSTLIDEVCGWVVTRKMQTSGFTTQLTTRYRKPVSTHEALLTIRARVVEQRRNLLFLRAEILNAQGEVAVEGEATYFLMPPERAREMGFLPCRVEGEEAE